jgi:hypothetical protein
MLPVPEEKPNIERIARFQSLSAGQYWRAIVDIEGAN